MTDVATTQDQPAVEADEQDLQAQPRDTNGVPQREVFISHKHVDSELAGELVKFVESLSAGNVTTYASSQVAPKGAKFGELTTVVKDALAAAGIVILLYTDPADNWEFCLWECGVATDPTDATKTRVEVLSVGGAVPSPYNSKLRVQLSLLDDDREADRTALVNFARAFTRDEEFWPDGQGALLPNLADHTIDALVSQFLDAAANHVRHPDADRERMIQLVDSMSSEVAGLVIPAAQLMADAATWGTTDGPHEPLFREVWNRSYQQDLERLAQQRVVFRPPRTVHYWERLIKSAIKLAHDDDDVDEPLIRLVSGESRGDPLEFWLGAVRDTNPHARSYEEPVREAAKQLRDEHQHECVERRFLLPESFFCDDPERIDRFQEIVDAMSSAGIRVAIGRLSDAPGPRWQDFAVIGRMAVSRFESVDGVNNRTLEQDFRVSEIHDALHNWQHVLAVRWSTAHDKPLRDHLDEHDRRI